MRKNFGAKSFLYPQPVMILGTYDENGKADAMNAAWGGIVGANEIIVDLSAHKTTDNIIKNKPSPYKICIQYYKKENMFDILLRNF